MAGGVARSDTLGRRDGVATTSEAGADRPRRAGCTLTCRDHARHRRRRAHVTAADPTHQGAARSSSRAAQAATARRVDQQDGEAAACGDANSGAQHRGPRHRADAAPQVPHRYSAGAAAAVRSELVGRAAALAILRDVVARALEFAAPQLVTVAGNQGTGKTRLIAELVEELPRTGDRAVRARSSAAPPSATPRPSPIRLAAITSLLRDRFEITPDPDDASRLRFAHEVREVFGDGQIAEMLHLIGAYVGLDYPATPFLRAITENPRQLAEVARTALRRFFELDAGKGAIVLVLDDLQSADDDTLALIHELAVGLGGSPVVVFAAARPEMLVRSASWGEGAIEHARIDVRNLEAEDAEQMFRNLLARCARVPDDTVQDAVEMTGGNPAFLEQLVRLFLQNGTIDATGAKWQLDPDKAAETELPISIEEAIEAQDRRARARRARPAREGGGVRQRVLGVLGGHRRR